MSDGGWFVQCDACDQAHNREHVPTTWRINPKGFVRCGKCMKEVRWFAPDTRRLANGPWRRIPREAS